MNGEVITKENVTTSGGVYERFAVKTHFVNVGEDYYKIFSDYVMPVVNENDIVICSEKVVALCQNRVLHREDIKISAFAKFLSKFASHPSWGIGVGEPIKMQFAINEVGILKVLYASAVSAIGKLFGKRGLFYEIVGEEVSGLDGFYGNIWEEYRDLGILIPENPNGFCDDLFKHFGIKTVIVDANDLGQEILGKCSKLAVPEKELLELIRDNPAGQDRACTPFIVARKLCENP